MRQFLELYPLIVLTIGLLDAIILMIFGVVFPLLVWFSQDSVKYFDNVMPGILSIVISNIAAVLVLACTHWMLS